MSIYRGPVAIAYSRSNRKNAKIYIKEFRRKAIDDVLDPKKKLSGIKDDYVIHHIAFGNKTIQLLKDKINKQDGKKGIKERKNRARRKG